MIELVPSTSIKMVEGIMPPPNEEVWWWLMPDQFYGPIRDCATPSLFQKLWSFITGRAFGCPAVVRFGDMNNPDKNSHQVELTKPWQLFQADLLALSQYRVHWWELVPDLSVPRSTSLEYEVIAQAWRSVYGDHTALTNWPRGEARQDFVSRPPRDLDAEVRKYPQILGMATNSYKGELRINQFGQAMLGIETFNWEDGPPVGYGLEILNDPRVAYCTIQYAGGSVGKFSQLSSDVPFPQITRFQVYCAAYKFRAYYGERRKPYYKL